MFLLFSLHVYFIIPLDHSIHSTYSFCVFNSHVHSTYSFHSIDMFFVFVPHICFMYPFVCSIHSTCPATFTDPSVTLTNFLLTLSFTSTSSLLILYLQVSIYPSRSIHQALSLLLLKSVPFIIAHFSVIYHSFHVSHS